MAVADLQVEENPTDMDSHADTCVVGKNAIIVHKLDKQVNVTGFDPSQGKVKNLYLLSAALAYEYPTSGEATILMVHKPSTCRQWKMICFVPCK